jgi:hypothetical protein
MKIYQSGLKILAGISTGAILLSCQKDSCPEPVSSKGDYYPTTIGSHWTYEYTWLPRRDSITYTRTQEALKDTLYEGKNYTYFGLQLIRKENGNYYRRTNFYGVGEEYIFLKDNLPAGSAWIHSSFENHKAVFTIQAIHQEKEVNGIRYRDVIEVQKQDFYKYEEPDFRLNYTAHFFYAKNIGEIYSFEDNAAELASDTENKLIEFNIK